MNRIKKIIPGRWEKDIPVPDRASRNYLDKEVTDQAGMHPSGEEEPT